MKTHTARWFQSSPDSWVLKARAQDGGAVLARIQENVFRNMPTTYTYSTKDTSGLCNSRYAAQRAVRAALAEAARLRERDVRLPHV